MDARVTQTLASGHVHAAQAKQVPGHRMLHQREPLHAGIVHAVQSKIKRHAKEQKQSANTHTHKTKQTLYTKSFWNFASNIGGRSMSFGRHQASEHATLVVIDKCSACFLQPSHDPDQKRKVERRVNPLTMFQIALLRINSTGHAIISKP